MLQRYTFLHKTRENENIFVLNFAKSNNLKVLLPIFLLPFYHFLKQKQGGHHVVNRLVYY